MSTILARSTRRGRRGAFRQLGTITPARLQRGTPVVREKPLHEQFQRIGGGLTPAQISAIVRQADAGQPEQLVDLFHENRQRDGHLHSTCESRDKWVSKHELAFIVPEDASEKEQEARDLCQRIYEDFRNWPQLIQHLTRSYIYSHATAALKPWEMSGGYLIPNEAVTVHPREFIFEQDNGALRYRLRQGDITGVDLLALNPGRVIQLQRSIVGDAPVREGLMRLFCWMASLRNFDLKDWIALAEIGWKPWRWAKYKRGAHQADIDRVVRNLERIGSTGVGAFSDQEDFQVEWPKASGGSSQRSTHLELFDALGREISKAGLGQTTSIESGPNGTRSDTSTRDELRKDRGEDDAVSVAAVLRHHMFIPAVRINLGEDVRCPAGLFQTEDATDRKSFAEALEKLHGTGMPIPAKWARDEVGMPEPQEGEEIIPPPMVQVPADLDSDDEDEDDMPGKAPKPGSKAKADDPQQDGKEYTDRLVDAGKRSAADALSDVVATMLDTVNEVQASTAGMSDETRKLVLMGKITERYREAPPPVELATVKEATLTMARLGGMQAVRVEDGGLEPDEGDS